MLERAGQDGIDAPHGRAAERQTLAFVAAAHFVSHFHILTLPALIPFLKDRLGVGFIELGLALTVFNVVSGLTQAPTGYLVDRVGARRVLAAGLVLGGLSFLCLAAAPSYPLLIAVAASLGLANAVYHPADYAILSASVAEKRIGRAFSIHLFAGYLGGALAPPIIVALVAWFSFGAALVFTGCLALVVAVPFLLNFRGLFHGTEPKRQGRTAAKSDAPVKVVTPAILALTGFFALISLSQSGIQNFSVAALSKGYGVDLGAANLALTAFLMCSAMGVLVGGFVADRASKPGMVAALGFTGTASLVALVAAVVLPSAAIIVALGLAGFLSGLIQPSRDVMVRRASPPGAAGRVFGVVTTGFNIGGAVGPLIFGWLMDRGQPWWLFAASAAIMLLTSAVALVGEIRAQRTIAARAV